MAIFKKNDTKVENFSTKNVNLVKDVIAKSDDVVVEIYHFINKTLDQPNKQEISVYRKAILNLLNHKNDEKFKYIYEIVSRSVYDFKERQEKMKLELKNELIFSPNIFSISWEDVNKNIRESFANGEELSVETLKATFIEEHNRLNDLRSKINKMIEMGIDVPNKKDLEITERTFLKLTDLLNVFMLENFQDVGAMIQEIEVFEKRYNLDDKANSSVYLDANYKNITNLSMPKFPGDATNKAYVDNQIQELNKRLDILMKNK